MVKHIFTSVTVLLGMISKAVVNWLILFPHELVFLAPPPKPVNKTLNPKDIAQPFSTPEESKQKFHCSFWI